MSAGTRRWTVRLTAAAEADFREILRWTVAQFGQAQAHVYAETLSAALSELAAGPAVPPYRPDLETSPMAWVASIHCRGVNTKLLRPALFLNPSNSRGLKPALLSRSHTPRNSMELRFLIQFWMT